MRRSLALMIALTACGGGAAAPAQPTDDGTLRLKRPLPVVGEVSEELSLGTIRMQIAAGPDQMVPVEIHTEKRETIEVLEVGDVWVTKVRYGVAVDRKTQAMAGHTETTEEVLHGKQFVVWKSEDTIDATRDDGSPVTTEELDELDDKFDDDLGEVPTEVAILTGRAWAPGEAYTLSEDERTRMSQAKRGRTLASATITFVDEVPGTATFLFEAVAQERRADGMSLDFELEMTESIDTAKARPVAENGTAKLRGTVKGATLTGTMEMKSTTTYR